MSARRLTSALLLAFLLVLPCATGCSGSSAAEPPKDQPKLLLAFSSFRERKLHPKIYFYEHDGVEKGKIIGSIDAVNQRSDYHPSLSHDGRLCAFAAELENQTGSILLWDRTDKKLIELPVLNDSPNGQMHPSLTGDGKWLAFTAWNRPSVSPRWDVLLYDVAAKKLADLPGVNTPDRDERMPALSGDGKFLAYATNARTGQGRTDVFLLDRTAGKIDPLVKLNSPQSDVEPSLSHDGRLIAFSLDRPGGAGGRDVYL